MIYLDSSVALAHIFAEARSVPDSFWDEAPVSSQLLEYEVWTRVHARGFARSHGEEVRALLGRVDLIELAPAVLSRALEPFPVHVRTLDALHLATIAFLCDRGRRIELASYDSRLIAGARALGISVMVL